MAIVCCNLLLGYTLIKSNAASSEAMFLLYVDGEKVFEDASNWDVCYAIIQKNLSKTYTLVLQNDYFQTERFILDNGGNLIFDLNGHVIDGASYSGLFYQSANATPCELEITDSSPNQSGVIKNLGAVVYIWTRTTNLTPSIVKLSGGTITGCNSSIVFAGYFTFIMTGGVITDNKTDDCIISIGGWTDAKYAGHFEMSGGEIRNNTGAKYIVWSGLADVFISGGRIVDNSGASGSAIALGGTFTMSGGEIDNKEIGVQMTTGSTSALTGTMTGGKIVGAVNLPSSYDFKYSDNIEKTDDGYFEKVHHWGEWVVDEEPTPDHAGSGHRECATCYQTQSEDITLTLEKITVSSKQESYAVGDEADLAIKAVYTRSDNNAEVSYKLTNDDYEITYSNGDALVAGDNTVTISYQGKDASLEIHIHNYVVKDTIDATCKTDGKIIYECEHCDDTYEEVIPALGHEWGEWEVVKEATTESKGEERRYCLHDESHYETREIPMLTPEVPEAPKAETPENNTPWIMLFVGIGVGAVLLVGGITLGVVLSKRKSK